MPDSGKEVLGTGGSCKESTSVARLHASLTKDSFEKVRKMGEGAKSFESG